VQQHLDLGVLFAVVYLEFLLHFEDSGFKNTFITIT
jgi:hypothetical protein